jgi:hypothetical protein
VSSNRTRLLAVFNPGGRMKNKITGIGNLALTSISMVISAVKNE